MFLLKGAIGILNFFSGTLSPVRRTCGGICSVSLRPWLPCTLLGRVKFVESTLWPKHPLTKLDKKPPSHPTSPCSSNTNSDGWMWDFCQKTTKTRIIRPSLMAPQHSKNMCYGSFRAPQERSCRTLITYRTFVVS